MAAPSSPGVGGGGGAGVASLPVDVDIRLYGKDGKRKYLPDGVSCSFELNERGGMASGNLTVPMTWEQFSLLGSEYVDVYLFEYLIYRGWVHVPSIDMSPNENLTIGLQSLVAVLNKYIVRWKYAYGGGADLSLIATDLVNDFAALTNRLAARLTTDIQTVGVTLTEFDAVGRSLGQALNMLCDQAPNLAIWGVKAPSPVTDQIYFLPKPDTTGKYYSIGGLITGFAYPLDTGQIVNVVNLTGGPVKQPNLAYNGSFEEVAPASETVGNLLLDYSFEDNDAAWTLTGARKFTGMDATAVGSPKTGKYWLELDQNTESGIQVVLASFNAVYVGTAWIRQETAGTGRQVKLTIEGLDVSDVVIVTSDTGFLTAADEWEKIETPDLDCTAQPTVVKLRYRIETNGGAASNDGVLVDDVALIEKNGEGVVGWRRIVAGVANPSTFQWNYKPSGGAKHGGYAVRSDPSAIAAGTDYVEIRVTKEKRIEVPPNERLTFAVYVAVASALVTFSLGIVEYDSAGAVVATNISPDITASLATWNLAEWHTTADGQGLTTNANTRSVEVFIRHKDNDEVYFDGVFVCMGGTPPDIDDNEGYWAGENYERRWKVSDAGLSLSSAAAASITNYGEKEEDVSSPLVIDKASGISFIEDYFNQSAVPAIVARLNVDRLTAVEQLLICSDAKVKIVNLPSAPDALSPARVSYTITGDQIDFSADLGNERPQLAKLFRIVQARERGRQF